MAYILTPSYVNPDSVDTAQIKGGAVTESKLASNINVSHFINDVPYLSSYTETDPVFVASPAYGIASGDITNWNTAHGWGDHSTENYVVSTNITDDSNKISHALPTKFANMDTTARDALTPEAGWAIFNTTTSKLEVYDGTTWQAAW